VFGLTLLPLSTVFDAFPRAIRDLGREFHKNIELTIDGGDTALDKRIIEQLADPLVHLIRNAIDHGIELPAVREAADKPPAGALRITARQEGNRILVVVQDDGQGIDTSRLRAAALERGLITEGDLPHMTESDALEL